jgi:hypothetical protein
MAGTSPAMTQLCRSNDTVVPRLGSREFFRILRIRMASGLLRNDTCRHCTQTISGASLRLKLTEFLLLKVAIGVVPELIGS